MTLNDLEKLLSEKTGRKVEFGPLQHDATTLSFKKSLIADGRKIDFKWRPVDDGEVTGERITMDDLVESMVQAINETFEKENQ
jgi:hypothetical protein